MLATLSKKRVTDGNGEGRAERARRSYLESRSVIRECGPSVELDIVIVVVRRNRYVLFVYRLPSCERLSGDTVNADPCN